MHGWGFPTLGTSAAGWEAQETRGSRRKLPDTRDPPAAPIRSRPRDPDACGSQGLYKIPRGKVTLQ